MTAVLSGNVDTVGVVSQVDNILAGKIDTVSVVSDITGGTIDNVTTVATLSDISGGVIDTLRHVVDTVYVQEVDPASGGMPTAGFMVGTEGGNVAYTSNVTITLSGTYPTITSDAQLVYVKYIPTGGSGAAFLVNGQDGVTLTHSGGVIEVDGGGTPFASGDVYEVGINAPRLEVDYTTETLKNTQQNPIWSRYTSPVSLTTANDTLTTSWADVGSEIDCRGYTDIILYITLDINAALNARLRALGKWESAGTDEYNLVIETVSSSDIKIEPEYIEFNTDADQLVVLRIHTGGIPFLQIQTQEGTDGGDDAILTQPIKVNKIWK